MALKNFFKKKPVQQEPHAEAQEMSEKPQNQRPKSIAATINTPTFASGMRHELMVNHLFTQQCQRLWMGDGEGQVEGALIRKSMGSYLACPPSLAQSSFATSCAALNLPVSFVRFLMKRLA